MNYVSILHASVHRQIVCVAYLLALSSNLRPVVRAALKSLSRYGSLIVRLAPLQHPLILNGLAVGDLRWTGVRSWGGHFNRFFHVLVSLTQADGVRKASSFPPIYAIDLAELRAQNRFHDHDYDYLQRQFWFDNGVRS